MKRIAIGVTLVAILVLAWVLWPKEPRFEGRTSADWFEQYAVARFEVSSAERDEALYALRKLGTNAVPYVLDEALAMPKESQFALFMHEFRGLVTRKKRRYLDPPEREMELSRALKALNAPPEALWPTLSTSLESSDKVKRHQAIWLIGMAGIEEGVPDLANALSDADRMVRILAAQSLMFLGEKSAPALAQITAALRTNAVQNSESTLVFALGAIGKEAHTAIPVLEQRLQTTNQGAHIHAAVALLQIDPTHAGATAVIEQCRTNAGAVMNGLQTTPGKQFPKLIQSVLESTAHGTSADALRALHILGRSSPATAITILEEHMEADDAAVPAPAFGGQLVRRYWAAAYILRLNRKHEGAIAALMKPANPSLPAWNVYAINGLGEAAPEMDTVIKFLEQKAADPEKSIRDAAENALKRIHIRKLNQQEGWLDEEM